ncbi:hypothetical protein [Olsenella sp. Marseille-P4559]|uniref:hypothetical protein n=1 Tax=Olsenella sp. Marseille-P4559 TaxID=2364795 RepID=UPI001031187F|nr:hypothetical protein [Olsenella sp. Marseille-P4559]
MLDCSAEKAACQQDISLLEEIVEACGTLGGKVASVEGSLSEVASSLDALAPLVGAAGASAAIREVSAGWQGFVDLATSSCERKIEELQSEIADLTEWERGSRGAEGGW